MPVWLVGLIVLPTLGFVIGTSIERCRSSHEPATQLGGEGAQATQRGEGGGETGETHAAEGEGAEHARARLRESRSELRPLGVDIKAVPFVVLAALVAASGFARPPWPPRGSSDHRCDALFGVPDVTRLMFVLNAGGRLSVVRPFGLVR